MIAVAVIATVATAFLFGAAWGIGIERDRRAPRVNGAVSMPRVPTWRERRRMRLARLEFKRCLAMDAKKQNQWLKPGAHL